MERGSAGGRGVVRLKKASKRHRLMEMASTTSFFFFFFYVPFSILSFFILDFAGTTLSNTYILLTSTGFAILKGAMT